MFRGSITALITPFKNGELDKVALEKFVQWQIEQGSHGLVPCGTTGEAPTLLSEEEEAIFDVCVQTVKSSQTNIPVIAGVGSNSTAEVLRLSKLAKKANADALLIVCPYYNKPTLEGIYAHFKTIHDSTDVPIILYNVPGRCVVEMSVDTVCKLAELPRIAGLKDATSDVSRATFIKERVKGDFSILSGEDGIAGGFLVHGAVGCISVTSNVAPKMCADFQNAWANGDLDTFYKLQTKLAPLHKAMFIESSPAPVKYACSKLGLCTDELRLPLLPATPNARKAVDEVLKQVGII